MRRSDKIKKNKIIKHLQTVMCYDKLSFVLDLLCETTVRALTIQEFHCKRGTAHKWRYTKVKPNVDS